MNYEITDCIDAGTEYCPCHLAETGNCILCSQLSGKEFCDCVNWKGVCIYQEFIWNKNRAKEERKTYSCTIKEKTIIEEKIVLFKIEMPHKIVTDLVHPGSFVFLRNPICTQFYDAPISIMDANTEENYIMVAIELKGSKTRAIGLLKEEEKILVRGPFWNGIWGLKNIYNLKNEKALIIIRGIGQAPSLPVIKKLHSNGCSTEILIDNRPFEKVFCMDYIKKYNPNITECKMMNRGDLTPEFLETLKSKYMNEEYKLIYCAGPDVLSYKILYALGNTIPFSCCNNSRMCCGEGVCGCCTLKTNDHKLRRLCKLQTEPKFVLRGRRKL